MKKKIQTFRTKNVLDGHSPAEGMRRQHMISELTLSSQLALLSKNPETNQNLLLHTISLRLAQGT